MNRIKRQELQLQSLQAKIVSFGESMLLQSNTYVQIKNAENFKTLAR